MLDGGALPAWFSRTAAALREAGWLAGVVTVGQAFGGGLEAGTLHSGRLAARPAPGASFARGPGGGHAAQRAARGAGGAGRRGRGGLAGTGKSGHRHAVGILRRRLR